MASTMVGIIHGADTDTIYAVYSPDDDADLAHTNLLRLGNERGEAVSVRGLTHAEFHSHPTIDHLQTAMRARNKPGRRIL